MSIAYVANATRSDTANQYGHRWVARVMARGRVIWSSPILHVSAEIALQVARDFIRGDAPAPVVSMPDPCVKTRTMGVVRFVSQALRPRCRYHARQLNRLYQQVIASRPPLLIDIARGCRAVVQAARRAGLTIDRSNALDLVADHFTRLPLDTLRDALVVAGI